MFFLTLPKSVKIGDTVDCKINFKTKRVTYRDEKTVVIEPDDVRSIVRVRDDGGDLQSFVCSDAGGTSDFHITTPQDLMN
jgi:hypothetical protein